MIDKSESVNWPNVCWILGADHLTFFLVGGGGGGYGWFERKCPADWLREKKCMQINYWEKNILRWKRYRTWRKMLKKKKSYTVMYTPPERFGKKFLPMQTKSVKSPIQHSPTNVQWSCQPFRGRGKKRINLTHLWMSSINKMATLGTRGFFSRATGSFLLSAAGRTDTSGEAARKNFCGERLDLPR